MIKEATKRGVPAIAEDVPPAFLPGDGATPNKQDLEKAKLAATASCAAPVTTDDVVVISWIDSDAISLPFTANLELIGLLNVPESCGATVLAWSQGVPLDLFTDADRAYANAFLVKHSGNSKPPSSINPNTILSGGDFRLFNWFKLQYSISPDGFITNPQYIHRVSKVGSTPNPCTALSPWVDGQEHRFNGAINSSSLGIYLLTEGRIGDLGQKVNATINGRTTPWIWSVIKFTVPGFLDTDPFFFSDFPTHYVYKNGQFFKIFSQTALPIFIKNDDTYQRLPWEILR